MTLFYPAVASRRSQHDGDAVAGALTLNDVAGLVRRRRKVIGSRWRLLNPGQTRILRKLRCSPSKASHLVKAIAVLQNHRITHTTRG